MPVAGFIKAFRHTARRLQTPVGRLRCSVWHGHSYDSGDYKCLLFTAILLESSIITMSVVLSISPFILLSDLSSPGRRPPGDASPGPSATLTLSHKR